MTLGPWIEDRVLSPTLRVERAARLRPDGSECGAVWRVAVLVDGVWWRGDMTTRSDAMTKAAALATARGEATE